MAHPRQVVDYQKNNRFDTSSSLKRLATIGAITLSILGYAVNGSHAQSSSDSQAQVPSGTAKAYPLRLKHEVPMQDPSKTLQTPISASPITPGPAGAHLTYYGGPVVSNIAVVVVYYGSGSFLPALNNSLPTFYTALTGGTFMDMLSEYSTQGVSGGGAVGNQFIQHGSYVGSYTIAPSATNNGSTISDAQIQAEVVAQINAGHLPSPGYDASGNADTLYMLYFPAGKTITQGTSSSCVSGGFCAYHGTTTFQSRNLLYGVQPDMQSGSGCYTGCGNAPTPFQNYTSVASHEFAETITDAAVGLSQTVGPPLAWYDTTNGENGDICNAIQGTADGYNVQAEWSNLQNGCALGPVTFSFTNPSSAVAGTPFSLTVTAKDSAGATLTAYRGTIQFTSTDSSASLPANYTFVSGDSGVHTFQVTLFGAGNRTVSVSDVLSTGFKGTSSNISVTTSVGNDFSISASPASLSVAQGASGSSTISTAVASGSAATVSLSVSGAPAGVTASLSPTSVTAGASSTLSITTTASAVAGSYTLTVKGVEGSATHSTNVTVTITTSGGGSGITNGGFELGNFSGWTTSGASETVLNTGCHGGTYCARAGSTVATNGDSNIIQTFTAPSGATGLSFWYKMTCPDTITYDWATATLKDNTAGTTATPLPKTCATSASWINLNSSLTAGHSYTLTLTSHDDNYSSDPTYTLYDDVTITTGVTSSGVINPGFETGDFSGWTTTGASETVIAAGCHSGTYCGRAGNTTPTNGDSNIAQTFVVPAGKTQLGVYYKMTCPDTVTYDWATVTLKNNTLGTTATILPKTCATNAWTNILSSVTAGSSYTLTLTSHDDNYSSDPTYTLYDDITLQ